MIMAAASLNFEYSLKYKFTHVVFVFCGVFGDSVSRDSSVLARSISSDLAFDALVCRNLAISKNIPHE